MNKIAIQLELCDELSDGPAEHACMVVAENGKLVGVTGLVPNPGPDYSDLEKALGGPPAFRPEFKEALAAIGHFDGGYVLGPTIRVEPETMEGLYRTGNAGGSPEAAHGDHLAVQLDYVGDADDLPRERAYMLLGRDGGIIGVAGPVPHPVVADGRLEKVLAERLDKAVGEIGCGGNYLVGPAVEVSMETMDMLAHNWGRGSRVAILRAARTERGRGAVPLSVEATEARFDRAGDRELAAALWYLWRTGSRVVATSWERRDKHPDGEICPIGSFVMCVDDEGFVTATEFPTSGAALGHMMRLAGRFW